MCHWISGNHIREGVLGGVKLARMRTRTTIVARTILSEALRPKRIRLRMTIGAQNPQVFDPVVVIDPVDMVKMQR